jgi:hypothetical protein
MAVDLTGDGTIRKYPLSAIGVCLCFCRCRPGVSLAVSQSIQ